MPFSSSAEPYSYQIQLKSDYYKILLTVQLSEETLLNLQARFFFFKACKFFNVKMYTQ